MVAPRRFLVDRSGFSINDLTLSHWPKIDAGANPIDQGQQAEELSLGRSATRGRSVWYSWFRDWTNKEIIGKSMWHDNETTVDYVNFRLVAKACAELIQDTGGEPISIGISGGWGAGKSSL